MAGHYDYPQLDALREALVNMFMHSDYFSAACPRVRVFDDRIEFFNPGALPKPLKKLLEEDISLPRNPVIAKFFRVVKLAENAGYGFDKMIKGWTAYTGSPPDFDQGRDYTKATFRFKKKGEVGVRTTPQVTPHEPEGEPLNEPQNEPLNNPVKLTRDQTTIMETIKGNPFITKEELANITGKSRATITRNMAFLKEKGLLIREGSDKKGYWKVIGDKR